MRELDKKTAIPLIPEFKEYILAECGSGKTKIGASALSAHQNGRKCRITHTLKSGTLLFFEEYRRFFMFF